LKETKNLISRLQAEQKENSYISDEAIRTISLELDVPVAKIYGVVSFYSQFRLHPVGRHIIKVCRGTACHVAGSLKLLEDLQIFLGINAENDTTSDGRFTVEEVACLGCCSLAPAVMIDDDVHGKVNIQKLKNVLEDYK
jgi:NADH-quinone oxidoreductase subunit E